jgi:hypothetical protein
MWNMFIKNKKTKCIYSTLYIHTYASTHALMHTHIYIYCCCLLSETEFTTATQDQWGMLNQPVCFQLEYVSMHVFTKYINAFQTLSFQINATFQWLYQHFKSCKSTVQWGATFVWICSSTGMPCCHSWNAQAWLPELCKWKWQRQWYSSVSFLKMLGSKGFWNIYTVHLYNT